ncbi:hypothetical protein CC1G_03413 [Coprinopsis cinerea okayama7|uniref:SUN domain-containing protein n=1 Tax=Coprinopsis cinerea (strain Okayama-7 / 130 / ATCC MYA-4618 / FGSC 9003) TaxID=240176 RepID=A8NQM7_COPC7|nr:hypothetical protein CC1G_03413 [Coprinopsis cinerea okayama7\|eukprot:XP_001835631.2 hypothetical protein CC1G_03413 [Coprinopsis cinerea okayama7\
MLRLQQLPLALQVISLLFASTAFAEPTSLNDPLRAIALHAPKRPGPPICCLQSQSSQLEVPEDEVLLSFEEWKAKQQQLQNNQSNNKQTEQENSSNSGAGNNGATSGNEGNGHDPAAGANAQDGSLPISHTYEELASIHPAETVLPHFQVPTTDRFNYASLDCSARVHTAHRGAKSAASILSSKKDRYMLSPCKTKEKKFVVVELCDDIRIDTVQLANYEFFSGVFKDFSVSVAKTYTDSEGWTQAGTYRAKNVRGVQTFRFPETLRDFYRYIRIDFHSHYGNEYYCPVSLLRVYGLTHLEEWKWDIWMAESKAKQAEALNIKPLSIEAQLSDETAESTGREGPSSRTENEHGGIDATIIETLAALSSKAAELSQPVSSDLASAIPDVPPSNHNIHPYSPPPPKPAEPYSHELHDPPSHHDSYIPSHSTDTFASPGSGSPHSATNTAPSVPQPPPTASAPSSSTAVATSAVSTSTRASPSDSPVHGKAHNNTSSSQRSSSQGPSSVIILSSASAAPSHPTGVPPIHATTGGESVYRTIMNKLTALETNYTLYTRYMDQQNGAIRELIKRLGEDIGRLEGVTRAQRTHSQKMLNEWEKQRLQMLIEYNQLVSRVEHLSEEILLEKRLGVAQLCLMLAVLIFMGLTRGSRGEAIVVNGPTSMREWGKRHLSLSGDWTSRFRRKSNAGHSAAIRSRPLTAKPASPSKKSAAATDVEGKVEFPSTDDAPLKKRPLEPIQVNNADTPTSSRVKKLSLTRSRTPSLRTNGTGKRVPHTAHIPRPQTPTPIRPVFHHRDLGSHSLQRSSSHGAQLSSGRSAKSAKKWARTAHLHPVKTPFYPQTNSEAFAQSYDGSNPSVGAGGSNASDLGYQDVFSAPAGSFAFPKKAVRERDLPGTGNTQELSLTRDSLEIWDSKDHGWRKRRPSAAGRSSENVVAEKLEDADAENNWIDTDSVVDSSDVDSMGLSGQL